MLPLTLLFCQQLVVWPMKQQCSTRGLPPAWPPNGINPIAEQCPGFDADLLFPFFDQQYGVSGVLAPAVDTQPSFRLRQWTWSYLNLNLFSSLLLSLFFKYNSLFTLLLLFCWFFVNFILPPPPFFLSAHCLLLLL